MKRTFGNKPGRSVEKLQEKVQEKTVSSRTRFTRRLLVRSYLTIVVIVFAIIAFFAHMFPYFPIDLQLTRDIQLIHIPFFASYMVFVSSFGFYPQSDIMVGVIVLFLFFAGLRWEALVALIDAISVTLVGLVIKEIVGRPRPSIDLVHVMQHLNEKSFPSGHVMLYTAFFGFLWFLTYTILKKSSVRTFLLIVFSILIISVGPSRVFMGEHWSSDAFGAYLFGSIWLLFMINIYDFGKRRFFVKQPIASEKGKK